MAGMKWTYLTFLLMALAITGSLGRRHRGGSGGRSDDDDDDDDHDHDHHKHDEGWKWGAAAGLAIIFGIAIGCAALFSLVGWICCSLHSKCRKDRVSASTVKIGSTGSIPPSWTTNLIYKPEMAAGFGAISDGFLRLGPAHLVRNRSGTSYTDGAKWAVGMSKGKHIFEITWPWGHRGYHATVGLATGDASLTSRGSTALVGSNPKTWGLDIVKRKVLHRNKPILTCPTDGSYVPDKFLVYVDMDEGTLAFGNDVTYWGEVISGLPFQGTQPLYLMIGATKWQSELSVVYKGSASDGTDYKDGDKPPHHLPPLYHVASQAPPSYKEFDNTTAGGPTMVQPQAPPQDTMYGPTPPTPPPPYSRPPTGFKPEDV